MTDLRELQIEVFREYVKNGYLEEWTSNINSTQKKFSIAELGLVMTEISEAIEEIRKHKTDRDKLALAEIELEKNNWGKGGKEEALRELDLKQLENLKKDLEKTKFKKEIL